MGQVKASLLQQALDVAERLPPQDQEILIELIQHRLMERRRAEIARNAAATLQALREGRAHYSSIEDLKHDLLPEP